VYVSYYSVFVTIGEFRTVNAFRPYLTWQGDFICYLETEFNEEIRHIGKSKNPADPHFTGFLNTGGDKLVTDPHLLEIAGNSQAADFRQIGAADMQ
jgi:hypothetical protein